jgi:hypothetical protein
VEVGNWGHQVEVYRCERRKKEKEPAEAYYSVCNRLLEPVKGRMVWRYGRRGVGKTWKVI